MGIRSVVDVDVNDEKFKQFAANFEKYLEALSKTPALWAAASAQSEDGATALVSAFKTHLDLVEKTDKAEKRLQNDASKTSRLWRDLVKSSKGFLDNISVTTQSLLKWMPLRTLVGGLFGQGDFFGLRDIAANVSSTRRASLGLGTTYGEKRAFDANFGRLVDTNAFLSGVNESTHDVSKRSPLYSAGLSNKDIDGRTTAQVSLTLLQSLKRLADKTPSALLGQTLQARGLDQYVTIEEFERLKNTDTKELDELYAGYRSGSKQYDVSDKSAKSWQDFYTQLDRASENIQSVFVKGLQPLLPKLTAASKNVADWFAPNSSDNVWTKRDEERKKNSTAIAKQNEKNKGDLLEVLTFGLWKSKPSASQPRRQRSLSFPDHPVAASVDAARRAPVHPQPHPVAARRAHVHPQPHPSRPSPPTLVAEDRRLGLLANDPKAPGLDKDLIRGVELLHKLPAGLLWNTYGAESAYGKRLRSRAGAVGPMQFMPATAERFGVTDVMSLRQSTEGAAKYYDYLLRLFQNDIRKAVASYNWGEGNVKKDVARHGADWERFLPRETSNYLKKVLGGTSLGQGVRVDVYNHTGSSVVVTASQLPQ